MLYEPDIDYIQMEGEDGEVFTLGAIGTFEFEDEIYAAFFPTDIDEDDPDFGVIILRVVEELGDNEYLYEEIDDEDLQEKVLKRFDIEYNEAFMD